MSKRLSLSGNFKVVGIKKSTKAKMLKNLKVGDVVKFEVELKPAGQNRGTHATYIKITDWKSDDFTKKSFNELSHVFSILDLEEFN